MAFKNSILFDVLGNILQGKSEDIYKKHVNSEEFETASKFMILRYLTMSTNPFVRDVVLKDYLTLERMPEKILYKYLLMNIPRQNNAFIRYIK